MTRGVRRAALAAAVTGGAAGAYLGWGRSWQLAYTRWWAPGLIEPVQVISFIMTQRMLRGIRDRAEAGDRPAAAAGAAPTRAGQP